MIERPEVTFQKFANDGLAKISSSSLRKDHIISIHKETNRLVDDYTYYIDDNGLYWLTDDSEPEKIYVRDALDKTTITRKKEAEHFEKLEKWALEASEGVALWFSPMEKSTYPCSKLILHKISYSIKKGFNTPIKALAISSINIDIGPNDIKSFIQKTLPDETIYDNESLRSAMIIFDSDQKLISFINEVYRYNKNIKDIPKNFLSNDEVERRAWYISNMFSLKYDSWTITREMKRQELLGNSSISCGGSGTTLTPHSSYSETTSVIFGYEDQYGPTEFACPHCGAINTRPLGLLISNCQFCGGNVSC